VEKALNLDVGWTINSPLDIVALVALALLAVFVIMQVLALVRDGKIKLPGTAKKRKASESFVERRLMPCAPYVAEHTGLLRALQEGQGNIRREIEGIDRKQCAVSTALDVLLRIANGDKEVNGDLEEARMGLARADGYKEAKQE